MIIYIGTFVIGGSSLRRSWRLYYKQGRIHGYPSRVGVGRGSDKIDQPSSWAGAVSPKPPVNAKKAKRDRWTDGPTDQPTDRAGWRVACTRLKKTQWLRWLKLFLNLDTRRLKTMVVGTVVNRVTPHGPRGDHG